MRSTFGSIGLIYRPLSSENMTFFALPAFPRRRCACWAKKRSFSSTKPPSASKINSSGNCSCCSSFSSSLSSCSEREYTNYKGMVRWMFKLRKNLLPNIPIHFSVTSYANKSIYKHSFQKIGNPLY